MSQVFFRDADGIIGTGELIDGRPVRVSFAGQWSSVFSDRRFFGVDKRVTSSSRLPGKAIIGIVDHAGNAQLAECPKCHRQRINLGGPHSPQVHADGSQTDCVGDVVTPAWKVFR